MLYIKITTDGKGRGTAYWLEVHGGLKGGAG